jgi:DASS family divalent anion:Na+ symporter
MLSLVYFYIHYFFASATTHIAVLFPTFLALFIGLGINPVLAALMLSFLSILSSGLTHYGLASAPVFFGAGYMSTKTWWYLGLVMSVVYIAIWTLAGGVWWKVLGLW